MSVHIMRQLVTIGLTGLRPDRNRVVTLDAEASYDSTFLPGVWQQGGVMGGVQVLMSGAFLYPTQYLNLVVNPSYSKEWREICSIVGRPQWAMPVCILNDMLTLSEVELRSPLTSLEEYMRDSVRIAYEGGGPVVIRQDRITGRLDPSYGQLGCYVDRAWQDMASALWKNAYPEYPEINPRGASELHWHVLPDRLECNGWGVDNVLATFDGDHRWLSIVRCLQVNVKHLKIGDCVSFVALKSSALEDTEYTPTGVIIVGDAGACTYRCLGADEAGEFDEDHGISSLNESSTRKTLLSGELRQLLDRTVKFRG